MTEWEYLLFEPKGNYELGPGKMMAPAELNEMGAFGWELVTAVHSASGNPYLIFKRPVEEEEELQAELEP